MRRTIPVGLFFLATLPLACSNASLPDGEVDEAMLVKTPPDQGPPIIVRPPPVPVETPPPPPPVCSARTITWGNDQTTNTCAGGFEYHPYVAPCNALKEDAACGSPTAYVANTCHWKYDCRKKEFGVEQSLPNVVASTSFHVTNQAQAGCDGWFGQQEMGWTYPNPYVNNGFIYQAYTNEQKWAGWTPDNGGNYYGPGTQSCRVTFTGVVQYNTFHEFSEANDERYDDYYDNPCPENPNAAFTCYDYNQPTHWPSCRLPQFGLDPAASACGVDAGKIAYSGQGLSHAQFTGPLKAGLPYGETCTSCEDVLIDDPSAITPASAAKAQAKATCITNRMNDVATARTPATTFNAALNGTLVSELKLLAELEGDLLTSAQRDATWKATMQYGDQESCEAAPWAPTSSFPAACPAPPTPAGSPVMFDLYMRRTMSECMNFTQPHASAASAAAFAPRCFALSSAIPADANATCSYKAYRDEYRSMANSLILKIVPSLAIDPNAESTDEIQSKLALIEQWYEGSRALYPAGTDRTALWGDASGVMGAFWQAGLSKPFSNVVASNTSASNQFLNDATNVVRKVFVAAFTGTATTTTPPLRSAPLLYLVNDGFLTIMGRLDYVGLFHDMACRFKGCVGGNVQTEVSQMWNILGALGDKDKLSTLVTNAKMIRPAWSAVFNDIQAAHAQTIQAATIDAYGVSTYSPALLTAGDPAALPTPVLGVAQIIRKGSLRATNYASTGLLSGNPTNVIDVGLQDATLGTGPGGTSSLTVQIAKLEGDLKTEVGLYQAAQQAAITSVLGQLTIQQKNAQLDAQTKAQREQYKHLSVEVAGLQKSDAVQEAAFGKFMDVYNGVTRTGTSVDPTLMLQRHFYVTNVDPLTAAKAASGQPWSDIRTIAVTPSSGSALTKPLHVLPGSMLNIQTTGKWTPTCALRNAVIPGNQPITGAEASPTGPEGYYLSSTSSTLTAASASTVDSTGQHTSGSDDLRACAGVKANAGVEIFGSGGGAYSDTSFCANLEIGFSNAHTTSNSSSTGSEGRTSASFSSGLRLPNLPFPEAPVGALLLVQMKSNGFDTHSIVDVRVVQSPQMSILVDMPQGSDFYLVDNDVAGCGYSSPGSLNVTIAQLESTGAMFTQVGTAMSKALGDITTIGNGIIAQHTVLADDMAHMRSVALSELATNVPNVNQVPAALIALFNAYVDEQILHVERTIEIYDAEYQQKLIRLSFKQIADDVAANKNQARYYELLTANALANMDADWLTATVNPLLALVTNELYNAAAIRYPAAIPAIQSSMSTQLDAMTTHLDWASVTVELANQVAHLVEGIEAQFDAAVHHVPPGQNTSQVVLAFRNPNFQPVFGGVSTTWPAADDDSARALWTAVNGGKLASVSVRPEAIYKDGLQGALPCMRFAPVIDDMAIFVGTTAGSTSNIDVVTANGGAPNVMHVHDNQAFTEANGLGLFHFSDPAWLEGSSLYMIGGDAAFAPQTFTNVINAHSTNMSAAAGLSPFTTFDIDTSGIKTLVDRVGSTLIPEIDLVFQLETKPAKAPLTWIRSCANATTTSGAPPSSGSSKPSTDPIFVPPPPRE